MNHLVIYSAIVLAVHIKNLLAWHQSEQSQRELPKKMLLIAHVKRYLKRESPHPKCIWYWTNQLLALVYRY
jgi:hypothetical protein